MAGSCNQQTTGPVLKLLNPKTILSLTAEAGLALDELMEGGSSFVHDGTAWPTDGIYLSFLVATILID
jgi:hypothetical protein